MLDKFETKLNHGNIWMGIIKSHIFFNLPITIPNIQRIRDDSKVADIISYQCDYFRIHQYFNIIGVINVHFCDENNTYYLIDGQHRYEAFKFMYQKMGHDINIPIECVMVKTMNQIKENYKLINRNTPLPEFPENIDKNIPETVAQYFKTKYPTIWSKNSRARRPHIYFNFFQEALGFLTDKLHIKSSDKLQELLESYNSKLSQWDIKQFPDHKSLNENIIKKCKDLNFYLGMYKHVSDSFGYKWVQAIIEIETGEKIKESKKSTKAKIPKKIKNDSWDKHIGKVYGTAFCLCCCQTQIESKDFIGGHIISENNGGLVNIDNIIPICSACNSSMGSENMDIFIEKYYPNNLLNFHQRKYKIPGEKTNSWSWNILNIK